MHPSEFAKKRKEDWKEIELLLTKKKPDTTDSVLRFAGLFRALSTDLSLARALHLPAHSVHYLESLFAKSYRYFHTPEKKQNIRKFFLETVPGTVYYDHYVRFCVLLFYFLFFVSSYLAYQFASFADLIVGAETLLRYEEMHSQPRENPTTALSIAATGFYISNNIGLDLLTFGLGILGGFGSLFMVIYNSLYLGTVIGALINTPAREGILNWLPVHAPFELTAVGLSGGAGMRIGLSMLYTKGLKRIESLKQETNRAFPVVIAASLMTFIAAFFEAFLGPAQIPFIYKQIAAGVLSLLLIVYFIISGRIRSEYK